MTANDYISAGFRMSSIVSQTQIDACEALVTKCYLFPILGEELPTTDLIKRTTMVLAFMRLQRLKGFATRAGAKTKLTAQSQVDEDAPTEWSAEAHHLLEEVRQLPTADPNAEVFDVCGIYFKTNFINI